MAWHDFHQGSAQLDGIFLGQLDHFLETSSGGRWVEVEGKDQAILLGEGVKDLPGSGNKYPFEHRDLANNNGALMGISWKM